jgi:hypothetical protein
MIHLTACVIDDAGELELAETEQHLESYGLAFDYKDGYGYWRFEVETTPLVDQGILGWAGDWYEVPFAGQQQYVVNRLVSANGTKTAVLELVWRPFILPADGTYVIRAPELTARGYTKVSGQGYAWSSTDGKASATMSVDLGVGPRSIVAKDYTLMTDATSSETRTKHFDKTYNPLDGVTFQGFAGESVNLRAHVFASVYGRYTEGFGEVHVKQFGFYSNTANATIGIEQ